MKCGSDNPTGNRFCGDCGTSLTGACPNCGAENPPGKRFCGDCGIRLAANNANAASAASSLSTPNKAIPVKQAPSIITEGERKNVTALFADIKGSMELMQDLDPEQARTIIDPALKLMIDAIHQYGGYVVQSTGDGIFALFGAPVAHEDHPRRALYAALRLQEEIRRHTTKLRQAGKPPIETRVGVNTGEVVVRSIETGDGRAEYSSIGHSTSMAARMQALAPTGSIAVTDVTRMLCEGYITFKSLGATVVKGAAEPVSVYEATGLGPLRTRLQRAAARGFSKFVGRQHAIQVIRHAAEQAQSGRGQILAVMAEPGVGKSRLFFEVKATMQSAWTVLEALPVSHGKALAYLPIIDLLHGYFAITTEDDVLRRREKVAGKLLMLDRTLENALPYICSLLGISEIPDALAHMDSEVKKWRTVEAIKQIVLRESLNQPLMLIFEDLQWIDSETQDLLNLLADGIAHARVLLMVNYRPEYHHEWGNRTYYTQLTLDPLTREDAGEMLSTLIGNASELNPIKRSIIERTEGNPFFIEELVQVLFDEGTLVRNRTVKLVRALSQVRLPATVQAVLAERIDRLPSEQKELLQILAVTGRQFPLILVRRIAPFSDDKLDVMLRELQLAEFIYESPSFPYVEYSFKHVLTQEVAYDSLLTERRKHIHELVAGAIEELFAGTISDHYGTLVHHYSRSGNDLKAAKYLELQAEQAMRRSAYAEARDQLTSALERLRMQPDNVEANKVEVAVRHKLAICTRIATRAGFAASVPVEILERARELCEKINDDEKLVEVLEALAIQYGTRSEHQKARALREELLAIAARIGDPELIGRAQFWLGHSSMFAGNFVAAEEEFKRAETISQNSAIRIAAFGDWRSETQALASLTSWCLGFPDRAIAKSCKSFISAEASMARPAGLAWSFYWSGVLHVMLRDWATAHSHASQAITMAEEHGLVYMLPWSVFLRGWARVHLEQTADGLSEMLESRRDMQISGAIIQPWFFWGLADSYVLLGTPREGLEAAAEGLNMAQLTRNEFVEAELQRLKGECLLMKRAQQRSASGNYEHKDSAA
ncbi:MAG: AAA family ATPase, partial [Deltaproteobacteria bacterium]|nr:AAA family ATPase [Deltaproteobacteria bacterium]